MPNDMKNQELMLKEAVKSMKTASLDHLTKMRAKAAMRVQIATESGIFGADDLARFKRFLGHVDRAIEAKKAVLEREGTAGLVHIASAHKVA